MAGIWVSDASFRFANRSEKSLEGLFFDT